MSDQPALGGDESPQIPAEPIRRAIRALPTRRAGEIECQLQVSQQSQQQARAVEVRSQEQDEQLRLRTLAQQFQPDSRAGSPEPQARPFESYYGSDSSSCSDSDSDDESGQKDPIQEIAQAQWHPEWHPAAEEYDQGRGPLAASPHQQDTCSPAQTMNPLSILAAVAGEAPRVAAGPSIHTVPLVAVTKYSSLAGALTPTVDHRTDDTDNPLPTASYVLQSGSSGFASGEATAYHGGPSPPELVEGSSQHRPLLSTSSTTYTPSTWASGGHASNAQAAFSSTQYDIAHVPQEEPSSGLNGGGKGKGEESDDSDYQQRYSCQEYPQDMPPLHVQCQLSAYWCQQEDKIKYMWTSYCYQAKAQCPGAANRAFGVVELWMHHGGRDEPIVTTPKFHWIMGTATTDYPETGHVSQHNAHHTGPGDTDALMAAASGSTLGAFPSDEMGVDTPTCVPFSGQASMHTGLPMDTTEPTESSFAPMWTSGESATGHVPLDDSIEVDNIQHPLSLSPSPLPSAPTVAPMQLLLDSTVFLAKSSGQLASHLDIPLPADAREHGPPRVWVPLSVPGEEDNYTSVPEPSNQAVNRIDANQDLAREPFGLDPAPNVTAPSINDGTASGTSNLNLNPPATMSLAMALQPSLQDDASPDAWPLPPSAPSRPLLICSTCGCKGSSSLFPSQSAQLPISVALSQSRTPQITVLGRSPASRVHSLALHVEEDEVSTVTARPSSPAVQALQKREEDLDTEGSEALSCATTPSSPIRRPRARGNFWDETVFSLLGNMLQRMSITDDETPPMPTPTPAANTGPETAVVDVLEMPSLVRQKCDGDHDSLCKRGRSEITRKCRPVEEGAKAHQTSTSTSEGAELTSTSRTNTSIEPDVPSPVTPTTNDSRDLLTPISGPSDNSIYEHINNVDSELEGFLDARLSNPSRRKESSTRKHVKRAQRTRLNIGQTQTIGPTKPPPLLSVRTHAPLLVPAVITTAEDANASISLRNAEIQMTATVHIAVPSIVKAEPPPSPEPEVPVAASPSAIRPETSLLFGTGTSLLSGVSLPVRERKVTVAAGSSADQQHRGLPKAKKSITRTSRSTAKRSDIDKGTGAVARVEAPPARSQTADLSGGQIVGLQIVERTSDVGAADALTAGPLAQDVGEEPRMPGGADFDTEKWTPPSPPPSPPRRRNGYSRGAPVRHKARLVEAVDEVHRVPVPKANEGGSLVGFIISHCVRYLGFA
ncbi:hypothetical protein D9619_007867 [Psilocybe cf. subviscida]|uniref:Uncharacterized protein n=1 Tax=Psilocybe cf. subviscida TaxID=2480587 RepID=A0A8H5ESL8_9AGAR|nr:hypothetical protein D9619_007867 [Psilocybe cf. subviscida]